MIFGRIKIDKADEVFSIYIRTRDKRCVRCGRRGSGPQGIEGLQNSHFFGRANESTRFDPKNCDATCSGCHSYWGSTNHEQYRQFKIKQLGQQGFDLLVLRKNTYQKKDRKLALLVARELLKSLGGQK
jgi:5-methylcytosine-specific restriction endonuclease McrA